jgi:iron complex outermembrane recepter protein
LSPTTAVLFRPRRSLMLYVNYAEGLERGGQAPLAAANAGEVMPPLVTRQFETGAKFERHLLTIAGSVFDMRKPFEYTDPVTRVFVQEGDQHHRGAELTVTGRISRDLTVVGGMMHLNPRTKNTGNPLTEGRVTLATSRNTANLFVDYRLPGIRGVSATAGIYHNGRQYLNAFNTQIIDAWTRVDLGGRVELRPGGRPAAILVAVENVANRSYWVGGSGGLLTMASPRLVKVSLSVDF